MRILCSYAHTHAPCLVFSFFFFCLLVFFFFALGSMRSSVHVRLRIKPLRIYPGGQALWNGNRGGGQDIKDSES